MTANEAMVRVCKHLCDTPLPLPVVLQTMLGICELARAEGKREGAYEARAVCETVVALEKAKL